MSVPATVPIAPAPARELAPPVDLERVVLVCGVGRSGTSLLQSMLNAHPDLALPPETHFFRRYVASRGTRRRLERGTVAALEARLAGDAEFARAAVAPGEVTRGERDGALDPRAVHGRLLAAWARRARKARVGDKDPRNLDFLPELRRAYPRARVVHVVRDPRAVVASRMRAAWSADRPWWSHALVAQEQLRRGRAEGRREFGAAYIELRYEDLVRAPRESLARVAEHIGVEYSDAMLDFGASARELVAASEAAWKLETFGPLLADNDEKWRGQLDAAHVAHVEDVCREAFDELGYERLTRAPRARRALTGAAGRTTARLAFAVRRWKERRR